MKIFIYIALSVVLLLQGCGFQLRGSDQAAIDLPATYVQGGDPYRGITPALKRSLKASGVKVVNSATEAQVILHLSAERQTRRALSYTAATAKVRVYELNYQVDFGLRDKTGKQLVSPQTVNLNRDYTFDETAVIAKRSEESDLYKDMRRNAARQILRRIQVLSKRGTAPTTP